MIGRIDIRANAAHPNFPLPPVYMFAGAPSSPRVFGVPCRVGSWAITAVSVVVAYPDNSTKTVSLAQVDGTWIGVIPACATTGAVQSGFQIVADGTDENGDAVTGYCLGVGDLFVMERDFTATADGTRYYFHYCEETPAPPQVGDAVYADGALKWWDGTAWRDFGGSSITIDPALSTTSENPVQNKVVSKALYTGFTEWEFSGELDGQSVESLEWSDENERWESVVLEGSKKINVYPEGDKDATSLSLLDDITASRHLITPTKTSQLTNDSGFLTEHQDISGKLDGAAAYEPWTASVWAQGSICSHKGRLYKLTGTIANLLVPPPSASWWTETTLQSLLAAKANASDVNAALAQKASLTDLPYAMVTPGEWTFHNFPDGHTCSVEYNSAIGAWQLYIDGTGPYGTIEGSEDLTVLEFLVDGLPIIATRPSLPGHLRDRAVNAVPVSTDTTLTLPALENVGKARDLLVRLEISGSTVPTITISPDGNESVTYETDGDEFPVPDEAGNWLYSFTETAAHTFAVSLKKVNEVAQGGA